MWRVPAIALERLSRDGDGLLVYALKHPFRDGTTRVCCTGMYECRGRQAGIAPAIPLHFRHPWRSNAGSDITDPRVVAAILPTSSSAPHAPRRRRGTGRQCCPPHGRCACEARHGPTWWCGRLVSLGTARVSANAPASRSPASMLSTAPASPQTSRIIRRPRITA
jgi:hypothetical protein